MSPKRAIPTCKDVAFYAASLGYEGFDAEAFMDHWEARGWMMRAGIPLKSWQAAVRTWQRNAVRWSAEKAALAGKAKTFFSPAEEAAIADYAKQAAYVIREHRGYEIGRLYEKVRNALGNNAAEEVRRRAHSKR